MIHVTKTFLPPLTEYTSRLEEVWERGWITNHGACVQELEAALAERLDIAHVTAVSNGTAALQIAIQALGVTGDVITTPFSYVATTGSILWQQRRPVFADIDRSTFCIDPHEIESAITPQTTAIMATHVYGYPCDVEGIEKVARKHGLKTIYDGAQSFGTRLNGRSLAIHGDVTAYSFHATKLFHTIEGGGLATSNAELSDRFDLIRAFGQKGDDQLVPGTNAKMSEVHAAMGLCVLPRVEGFIAERRRLSELYDELLDDDAVTRPSLGMNCEYNYSYYAVLLPSEDALDRTLSQLNEAGVNPRRYFWPSLNRLPYVNAGVCPISEDVASRALCLPLYPGLNDDDVRQITELVNSASRV